MSLKDLTVWLPQVIDALNDDVKEMGSTILEEFMINANALLSLGLGYLTLVVLLLHYQLENYKEYSLRVL